MDLSKIDAGKLIEQTSDLIAKYAFDFLGAVLLLIFGWIFAGWMRRTLKRLLERSKRFDDTLAPIVANIARYTILAFVIVAVLAQFGVQTASVIALLGAAGIAIGLALQGTLSNIAAGVMILVLRPFSVGESIEFSDGSGTVEEVGLFRTVLRTFDGRYLFAPNSQLWNRVVINLTRNGTRRMDVDVGIGYDDDIETGLDVLGRIAEGDNRVLDDPAPQSMVAGLGDSAVIIRVRCWTKTADYWSTLWDMNQRAKVQLEDAGITIPYPQQDLHVVSGAEKLADTRPLDGDGETERSNKPKLRDASGGPAPSKA